MADGQGSQQYKIKKQRKKKTRTFYKHYLGEDIVWELFLKISEDCVSNLTQVILWQSLYKDAISPPVGATMAQQTVAINDCYHVELKQIGKAVCDIAVYVHKAQFDPFFLQVVREKVIHQPGSGVSTTFFLD